MNAKQRTAAMKLMKGPLSSQRLVDLIQDDGPFGQWIMGRYDKKDPRFKALEAEIIEEVVEIFKIK